LEEETFQKPGNFILKEVRRKNSASTSVKKIEFSKGGFWGREKKGCRIDKKIQGQRRERTLEGENRRRGKDGTRRLRAARNFLKPWSEKATYVKLQKRVDIA